MITLTINQKLITDETLQVFESGEYMPYDLVLVIKEGDSIPYYQFQAHYIKTGENYNG